MNFSGFKINQTKKAPLALAKVPPPAAKVEFIKDFDATTAAASKTTNEVKLVIPQSKDFLRSKPRKHLEARIRNEAEKKPTSSNPEDQLKDQAVQELIDGAKENDTNDLQSKILTLAVSPDELMLEGAAEPTDEDFENIKIEDFGKALMRGMGWTDPVGEAKKAFEEDVINVRARGLGLGADKLIKRPDAAKTSDGSSELRIKRNAKVKVLAGKHKDSYGIIESFEQAGRVTVKLAINSVRISINESIICPVTEREYNDKGKVLNMAKYDEYKKKDTNGEKIDESKSSDLSKLSRDRDSDYRKDSKSSSSRRSRSPKSSSRHDYNRRDRSRDRRHHRSRSPANESSSSRRRERSRSRENYRNGNHSSRR